MREISQFFTYSSSPTKESFPQLPDCIIWMRLSIGFFYGIYLGVTDYFGGIGLFVGVSMITFIPLSYVDKFLKGNTESYEGLTFKGVLNALSMLTLVWVSIATMNHPEDESRLTMALMKVMTNETMSEQIVDDEFP